VTSAQCPARVWARNAIAAATITQRR
jgi:hypothetical protein